MRLLPLVVNSIGAYLATKISGHFIEQGIPRYCRNSQCAIVSAIASNFEACSGMWHRIVASLGALGTGLDRGAIQIFFVKFVPWQKREQKFIKTTGMSRIVVIVPMKQLDWCEFRCFDDIISSGTFGSLQRGLACRSEDHETRGQLGWL